MSLICFLFWLLLNSSGGLTLEKLLCGVAVTVLVMLFARRAFDWTLGRERRFLCALPRLILYALWLVKEVLLSDLTAAKLVYTGRLDPVLFRVEKPLRSKYLLSALADSITLTPGTLTVETDEEGLIVYALTPGLARGTLEGKMAGKLRAFEGRKK